MDGFCDPLVGRFLNADPYVQMPDFSQNYNRYTYCLNNPLKFTDPSGYRLAGPEYDSSIDAINAYLGYLTDVSGAWKLPGGGGGGSFNSPWNRYESFWSSLLASVPSWQEGYSIKSSSFGKKNGVDGVWINAVNVGTPTRVGEKGSSDFKAFFFVDFTRKFIAVTNAQGGEGNPYSLYFVGNRLMVINENTGNIDYSTAATSGKGVYMNNPKYQYVEKQGPIPQGVYTFNNSKWNHQSTLRQIYNIVRGNGDWGEYNVPLTPVTYQGNRHSFYIHGGFFEGSAGCIDAGLNIDKVYNYVKTQNVTYLRVRY